MITRVVLLGCYLWLISPPVVFCEQTATAQADQPAQKSIEQQLKDLGQEARQLAKQNKYAEASATAQSALRLAEATYGLDDRHVAAPVFARPPRSTSAT